MLSCFVTAGTTAINCHPYVFSTYVPMCNIFYIYKYILANIFIFFTSIFSTNVGDCLSIYYGLFFIYIIIYRICLCDAVIIMDFCRTKFFGIYILDDSKVSIWYGFQGQPQKLSFCGFFSKNNNSGISIFDCKIKIQHHHIIRIWYL